MFIYLFYNLGAEKWVLIFMYTKLIQETSIELVVIGEDGIVQSVSEQPVFGMIKDLAILPWKDKFSPRNPQVCELL